MGLNSVSVMKGKVLDQAIDEKLQSIVTEASQISEFPVALITLILRRTQLYKAQVGLPKDLAAYRATDSCLSFCQYVVKNKKPLKIVDATKEPSLPQQLVQLYGIRAYYGYPIEIDGVVVGSLCIVDKKPNTISDQTQAALINLAQEASKRLNELASSHSNMNLSDEKNTSEHQKLWNELAQTRQDIQIALSDLYPVVRAMSMKDEDTSHTAQVCLAQGFLAEATKSYQDLTAAIAQLDDQLKNLKSKIK